MRPALDRKRFTLVVAAAAALIVGGAVASPIAATATTPDPPAAVRVCGPPVPGHVACDLERVVQPEGRAVTSQASAAVAGLTPADLASAYKISPSKTTATVAVIGAFGAPTLGSDLATYRSHFGLPPCTTANGCLTVVNQQGHASPLPKADTGWAEETDTDVDMVSAICPTCHILVVQATTDDLDNFLVAISTAAKSGAHYVSMSVGTTEDGSDLGLDSKYFSTPGVTYLAAGGDDGYAAEWPATSPNVISVGGTHLVKSSSSARGWTETVWGNRTKTDGGTGSGCSINEAQPAYQAAIPALHAACSKRAINDLAAVGDPATGVAVFANGAWSQVGGTSVATPIIAGMYALTGATQSSAQAAAYAYAHTSRFNDVTSGVNGECGQKTILCTAGRGWDGPTGVGTPNGIAGLAPVQQNSDLPPCTTSAFSDVPVSNAFCGAIAWLVAQKITSGYADGGFHPTASISRQAMAAFLYRLQNPGQDAPACTTAAFSDVPADNQFCGAIAWLAAQKITTGFAGDGFHPTVAVSRQAMTAFLYRLDNPGQDAPACTTAAFSDVPVGNEFCGVIAWLVAQKITTGYADGGFHPTAAVSRQAMAAFLYRLQHPSMPSPQTAG